MLSSSNHETSRPLDGRVGAGRTHVQKHIPRLQRLWERDTNLSPLGDLVYRLKNRGDRSAIEPIVEARRADGGTLIFTPDQHCSTLVFTKAPNAFRWRLNSRRVSGLNRYVFKLSGSFV